MGSGGNQIRRDFGAAHRGRSLAAASQGNAVGRRIGLDGRGRRPPDACDRRRLCGVESPGADGGPQSLVRAGGGRQSATGSLRPPLEAELYYAGQGAAAELCAVLLARRRRAAILFALSRQFLARVL